jgi:hypothetical protein
MGHCEKCKDYGVTCRDKGPMSSREVLVTRVPSRPNKSFALITNRPMAECPGVEGTQPIELVASGEIGRVEARIKTNPTQIRLGILGLRRSRPA